MTRFTIWEVWPKALSYCKESERSQFKPHKALSCYLAVPQPTLSHYQKDRPTTLVLIKILT